MINRELINSKTFIYNSFILGKLNKYNLSKDEFILFIYFLNSESKNFDIGQISNYLYMDKPNILSSLNLLIEKKLIELKTDGSKKGNIREYVSLEKFYSCIEQDIENNSSEDISLIDEYIKNKLDIEPKQINKEFIKVWIERGFSTDYIKETIDKSLRDGKADIRYIDKLLYEKPANNENNKQELFDYDWLDEKK